MQEALAKLEQKKVVAERDRRNAALVEHGGLIFNSSRQVTLGNVDGKITLVEFFDYNCGYCKRALSDMLELMRAEPQLRIVLKEFPVLGANSIEAAKVAVAVRMQDEGGLKYLDFHKRLMAVPAPADRAKALASAKDAGLDMVRLERDLASREIGDTLEEGKRLATALGIRGTPSYVLGNEVIPGAIGHAGLRERLQRLR